MVVILEMLEEDVEFECERKDETKHLKRGEMVQADFILNLQDAL